MARSAPKVSFSVTSINYGTIDVGASSAMQTYNVYQAGRSNTTTEAINMSISFKESSNASEARKESWCWVSTAAGAAAGEQIGSVSTGPEETAGSVVAGTTAGGISIHVRTDIKVPALAATAGAVSFYLHHRYQYTGY